MSRDWTQEEFKQKDGKMTEECRLITKEEYEHLHLENTELRELLKLISDELNYCDTLSFAWNPIRVSDGLHRIQLLIFKQLNKGERR